MKKRLNYITLIGLLIPCWQINAQMEVTDATTPPYTPENLISNIFLGSGVSIIDISYEGNPLSVGFFKGGENTIGLDRGIVLTSGRAAAVSCNAGPYGANCTGNDFASNETGTLTSDSDLNAIANGTPEDITKYTITFQPFADTLRFRYVFASEEYPEFSCSPYNDVFGFFISGPGITGPYSNNGQNIALIPGTNQPVSIDNIHPDDGPGCPGINDQYYHNNDGSPLQPVYDGYLNVFTAEAIVIPCETYTIKIMIADVADQLYDSGVFLEAKSFGTGTIDVEVATVSLDGTIAEGCSNGAFILSLPVEAQQDVPLDYTIIGDAINGTDYEPVPADLFIPQGNSSITININSIVDNLDEGLESIGLDIQRDICNRDTFWMYIRDNNIVPPDPGPNPSICQGDSVQLDGNLPLPLPQPPSFTNQTDFFIDESEPVYSPIQVIGVQPVTLGPGVIRSVCVNISHKWVDDLDLYLISPGGRFIELSTMNGANCDNYNNVCFSPHATDPINYVFPWPTCGPNEEPGFSNGTFQPEGVWDDLWGDPVNGTWQLLVLDESNGFDGEILDWTITFEPLYQLFYQWQPADGLSCTDCPAPVASPATTTTYYLTAWDTYNCEVYDTVTVVVNEMAASPVVNCVSVTNNSLSFEWSDVPNVTSYEVSVDGGPFTPPNNGPTGHTVTGLSLNQSVTIVVNAIGSCGSSTGMATCQTPDCDAPSLTIDHINHVDCFGNNNGSITATATGGAGDYVYVLNNSTPSPQGIFTGLAGGVHTLSVVDAWGCPNGVELTINEPDSLSAAVSVLNHVTCFGAANASATLNITGGTPPYTVNWNNGQQQDTATNLFPGSLFVFVTDANGCTDNLNFLITQPPELVLTTNTTPAGCSGSGTGSATVEIEGGTPPYFINWDAGAFNATTPTVSSLPPGNYTVAVTDANGCIQLAEATVGGTNSMTLSLSSTNVSCFSGNDGTAAVTIAGGSPPYSYNWSNGQNGPSINALPAGTYSVTVTDATGCTNEVSVTIEEPAALGVSLSANDVLCSGDTSGAITSNPSGGTPPYSFAWNNGANTPDQQNLPAGTYCLTVIDANGCEMSECVEIADPAALQLVLNPTNAACNNPEGSVDMQVSGGLPPYQFLWSNGQTTEDVSGLLPGTYQVSVTDANGCAAVASVTIEETTAISIDFSTEAVLCYGDATGSIEVTASGGSGNYSFLWSGPNGFTSTHEDLSGIPAGNYQLHMEDSDGCLFSTVISIDQPSEPLDLLYSIGEISCPGAQDGSIELEATGGTPPYAFRLDSNNWISNPNFLALGSGFYQAFVQDDNGCLVGISDIFLNEPDTFSVELGDDIIANYGELVYITPNLINVPDSAFSHYTYLWSSSNPNVPPVHPDWRITIFEATGPTTITLTVTSENGCVEEDLLHLFVLTPRQVVVPTAFSPDTGGPQINNALHVHGPSKMVEQIKLFRVFDRWGELLFEARDFPVNDLTTGWDGTFKGRPMPPGVYVWYLEVDYVDGASESYKGHTTLIR